MGTSHKNKQFSFGVSIAIGIGVCLLVSLGAAAGAAGLVLSNKIREEHLSIVANTILFLSCLAGNITAAKLVGKKTAIVCGLVALGYIFVLGSINILLFEGELGGIGSGLLIILAAYGGSCLIALPKKSKHRRYKKARAR